MKIPNLPDRQIPLIDENKNMHPLWHMFFNQLIQEMQTNLSEEGIYIPSQSTDNIAKLQTGNPLSSIISNKDTGDVYLSINGQFKKITTS